MGLKNTGYQLMKVSLSCKVVFGLGKKRINIFHYLANEVLSPSKNIILKGHPIIYPLKQRDICDYNTI